MPAPVPKGSCIGRRECVEQKKAVLGGVLWATGNVFTVVAISGIVAFLPIMVARSEISLGSVNVAPSLTLLNFAFFALERAFPVP